MSNFKFVIVLAAFLVASCVGVAIDARLSDISNIDQCDPTAAKIRLLETNLYEPAKFLAPVVRTLNYPESGINSHLITCLKIINTDTSDHGGHPEIVSGGVGSYDVQIRLVSQWGQPLSFRIEIWADEDDAKKGNSQVGSNN